MSHRFSSLLLTEYVRPVPSNVGERRNPGSTFAAGMTSRSNAPISRTTLPSKSATTSGTRPSLCRARKQYNKSAGANAHAFTADWARDDIVRVPRVAEMAAFVDDYETARGTSFTAAERRTIAASCVYSVAYTARCNHAIDPRAEAWNGDFRPLLRAEAEALLAGQWI